MEIDVFFQLGAARGLDPISRPSGLAQIEGESDHWRPSLWGELEPVRADLVAIALSDESLGFLVCEHSRRHLL